MSCIPVKFRGGPTILHLYLREIKDDALLTATEEVRWPRRSPGGTARRGPG